MVSETRGDWKKVQEGFQTIEKTRPDMCESMGNTRESIPTSATKFYTRVRAKRGSQKLRFEKKETHLHADGPAAKNEGEGRVVVRFSGGGVTEWVRG